MPIEKMPQVLNANTKEEYTYEFIGIVYRKINELIDFINTREQDRSEQMARIIDRLRVLESQNEMNIETMRYFNDKLFNPENATQPKEEECNLAPNCCYHGKCICGGCSKKEEPILGCPWCSSTVIKFMDYGYESWRGECQNCGAVNGSSDTKQEAVKEWNTRK